MGAQAVRLSNVDIDNALKNKDFEVLFQPIFDLGNGALARVETFVRWRHPTLGVLPPGAFISFFESQGRMSELTRYVLAEALDEYRNWRGASAPGFSINLALSDLSDDGFAAHFSVLLRDCGFPADLITLECPMPPVTMQVEHAAEYFQRLCQTGARLAIEVRGRANDFLRQIEPFPFDEIKTGGAAILRFARTVRGPGLSAISELLDIASKANAAITAVGVEDQASLAALRGLGFAAAQGNHLGRVGPLQGFTPSRVNEVRALLGLEPLSPQDLQALFRTEAPAPQPARAAPLEAEPTKPAAVPEGVKDDDALVERLAARLARQAAIEGEAAATDKQASAKAAAIARVKRKAAAGAGPASAPPAALKAENERAAPERAPTEFATKKAADQKSAVARGLQERLSREFAAKSTRAASNAGSVADALDEIGDTVDSPEATPLAAAASHAPIEGREHAMTEPEARVTASDAAQEDASASPDVSEGDARRKAPDSTTSDRPSSEGEAPGSAAPAPPLVASPPPAAALASGFARLSMSVANARAFFRPGIRIGYRASSPPRAPEPPVKGSLDDDSEITFIGDTAPEAPQPAPSAEASAPKPAADPAPEPVNEMARGPSAADSFNTEAIAAATAPRAKGERPHRKKTFLTRTVIPYPTHFWPKSWKRAFKRREAGKAEPLAEPQAEAAE